MKKNSWLLHLYRDEDKTDLFKVMEFQTIKDISDCIEVEPQVIRYYFHGLIKPRGFLKFCILYQSIPL